MAGQARKHHYVPKFYLAGFTKNDSKDGELFVIDKNLKKTWNSTPRGSAHKRDFHAIELEPGSDPMAVEKLLAQLEGQWSSALATTIGNKVLPEDESFGDLMAFVAFMAVRVPRIRDILSNFIDTVSKAELQLMFSTAEGQEQLSKTLAELGHEMSDDRFEQLLSFAKSENYDINFDQTWHVQEMIHMATTLAPLLSLRKWCLRNAEDGMPDLICSDSPVAPTWVIPMPGTISPAFGTPNTIVSVPLNRRIALVSMIEEELPAISLDRHGVASVNSMTMLNANQLYSSEPNFVWRMADDKIGEASEMLDLLRTQSP